MDNNAMFYVGQTPWHGLGEKLEIAPDTNEALKLANLNWDVYKGETFIQVPKSETNNQKFLDYSFYDIVNFSICNFLEIFEVYFKNTIWMTSCTINILKSR